MRATNRRQDLEARLEGYRKATGPRAIRSHDPRGIGRYATATASALALAGGAEASVIYSGIQNIEVHAVDGPNFAGIDLDGNLGNDVQFAAVITFSSYVDQSFGDRRQTLLEYASVRGLNGQANIMRDGAWPARLSSGNQISAGGVFAGTFWSPLDTFSHYRYWSYGTLLTRDTTHQRGNWPASGSGFLGVALHRGSDTHYGWIRLQLGDEYDAEFNQAVPSADVITIVDWAWESVPGRSIEAGATVPEPSTLTLLAAGALGVHAFRKRRRDPRIANDA